ncbi:MAG TPA: DegT/DnrJ/EryC1/StrS family aminotransferase [Solirubrobacterales bacterium]|nr:DegT/DnrJ/EryC1/StrS family aminotransferase [Solirubrobacterales bacterium]
MGDLPVILGGRSVRAGKIWPAWPQHGEAERNLLQATLESGSWSTARGTRAADAAEEFAAYQGARYGLPLANGSCSLEAALAACGIGPGDEVLVPGLTFVTTAIAALAVNATPVFVDVEPTSLCLDVAAAEAAATERTRAVIPVHLAGRPCDLDALSDLCQRHDLAMIEDCAHAHGSSWGGRGVGSFGSFGSFSFQEGKLITAGEGGALIADDEALRSTAWSYANCGRIEGRHRYDHANYGTNMRMTEWQGAVLQAQLQRLPQQNRVREERARLLDAELPKIPGLRPQSGDARITSRGRYAYVLHYDPAEFSGLPVTGLVAALRHEGILAGESYPSLNTLELFRERRFERRLPKGAPRLDYAGVSLPNAEHAAAHTVWLDHRMLLAEPDDVLDIVRALEKIRDRSRAIRLRTSKAVTSAGRMFRAARRGRPAY